MVCRAWSLPYGRQMHCASASWAISIYGMADGCRCAACGIPAFLNCFVPNLPDGTLYKYEIKAKGGLTYLKADPYANAAELRPNTASIVSDLSKFTWTDEKWLADRKKTKSKKEPMAI